MLDDHPRRDTLQSFLLGELDSSASRGVVKHLVAGCPVCRSVTADVWRGPGRHASERDVAPEASAAYDAAIERAVAAAAAASVRFAGEQGHAERLCGGLFAHPPQRQLLLVCNSASFATWAVCERVLAESWGLRFDDPLRMRELAQVGVEVARRLDPQRYGALAVADLQGRAWTALANAHRVLSEYADAEAALSEAAGRLAAGSGDLGYQAWQLYVEALLRSSQGRDAEAEPLLNRVVALYRRCGDLQALGRALISKGTIRNFLGDPDGEIVLIREGLQLIDADAEPKVAVAAWHNLIRAVHDLGRHREALSLLARARPLYVRCGDRTILIHFQWLEGNISLALGRLEQAEGCLREVRRAFADLGMAKETALVSLDLADTLSRQGRFAEVRSLAVEMIAIFRSRQVHAEALAAMLLFQRAAESEQVTAALLRKVAEAVQQEPERTKSRSGG
jgi:tetratricopeptide (TPR) repeat protein